MASNAPKGTGIPPQSVTGLDVPLAMFTCFSELPPELRLQIWALAIETRIIHIYFAKFGDFQDHTHSFKSTIPSILHVNNESRKEGLRFYHAGKTNKFAKNKFYFCPQVDIINILLSSWNQMTTLLQQDDCGLLSKVQRITMPEISLALFNKETVKILYLLEIREITFTKLQKCEGDDEGEGCKCPVKRFADFGQLTSKENEELVQDKELIIRGQHEEILRQGWKECGEAPYPVVWGVAICGASEDWARPCIRSGGRWERFLAGVGRRSRFRQWFGPGGRV